MADAAPRMGEVILRAEGIGKTFGQAKVLYSAGVWGEVGRVSVLLGRNGSGKTTLFRVLCGTLRPDHGVVTFRGESRERVSLPRWARAGLMYVPQEQLLCRGRRVGDHFRAVASLSDVGAWEEPARLLRVEGLLSTRTDALSRGERMRVSAALAIVRAPAALVIDEPLAGIAPLDQELVGSALRRLAERGTAVITSGHDARVLLGLADVVVWCTAGTTHYLGTPEAARSHDQFRREYLGPGAA